MMELLTTLELFSTPFFSGLAFALYLPMLGCYLRLRDENLAALAFAQVGAAGTLGAMAAHLPLTTGGLGAATLAAAIKQTMPMHQRAAAQRSTLYAALLLLGWSISILLTSNLPLAERLGHALFDGQLLLNGGEDLVFTLLTCVLGTGLLFALSRRLLLAQIFPDIWRLKCRHWRSLHLVFDVLAALSIALATMRLGVMAVFAFVLITPWLAFAHARSWQQGRVLAVGVAALSYLVAFACSLVFDQAFGPVMALTLIIIAAIAQLLAMLRGAA